MPGKKTIVSQTHSLHANQPNIQSCNNIKRLGDTKSNNNRMMMTLPSPISNCDVVTACSSSTTPSEEGELPEDIEYGCACADAAITENKDQQQQQTETKHPNNHTASAAADDDAALTTRNPLGTVRMSLWALRFAILAEAINSLILGPNYALLVLEGGTEVRCTTKSLYVIRKRHVTPL